MPRPVAAIVGYETLLGRELRDLMTGGTFRPSLRLLSSGTGASVLSQAEDEPVVIGPLEPDQLAGAATIFLAGTAESSRRVLELSAAASPQPVLIDLTGALEDDPRARLRAPDAEPGGFVPAPGTLLVIAHPAAIALAIFLNRLNNAGNVRRSVAQVFEPASERGQTGISELQRQTVNLLSLKKLPTAVFDAQLGFNLLVRYGSEAPVRLEDVEARVDRHLATLLSLQGGAAMPSLRLAQAPVFHGYSFSVWVEFETAAGLAALRRALASARIEVRGARVEPPTNAGAAGQSGITVGAIESDRNNPRAAWFWIVADNLRLSAENAVAAAHALAGDPAA